MATPFTSIYNRFLGKVTDDMYLELTPEDTIRDLQNILIEAIPDFEFPRFDLYDYTLEQEEMPYGEAPADAFLVYQDREEGICIVEKSHYNIDLTSEEINILYGTYIPHNKLEMIYLKYLILSHYIICKL